LGLEAEFWEENEEEQSWGDYGDGMASGLHGRLWLQLRVGYL
jgi:hypothetical protein